MRYRSDIDGLRTIAVVPVILFHLGIGAFAGGFVGVDVFFVISGFLITANIRRDLEGQGFSILRFYERRMRRILPALIVVMAFCLAAGWLLFLPDDFRDLGSSLTSTALFTSNMLFWYQADYFSGPVELKPLVHTWSLSVEEQYYIVFPLFIAFVARYRSRRYVAPTAWLALASFIASVVLTYMAPSGAYYLLPSRAWELLIGSLLAQGAVPRLGRRQSEAAAAAGLAMVLAAVFLLSGGSRFPGVNALWPCLGSALILHAGESAQRTAVARLLGWKPIVAVGLISYSLYLWHWPLIVFAHYQLMAEFDQTQTLALILVIFVAAVLSWRFVERPFRNRHRVSRRAVFVSGTAALTLAAAIGAILYVDAGVPQRFAGLVLPRVARADEPLPGEPRCFLQEGGGPWAGPRCFLSAAGGKKDVTLLWGDSHAYQYRRAIRDHVAPRSRHPILLYTSSGCPPLFDVSIDDRPGCRQINAYVEQIITRYDVTHVVLAGHWRAEMTNNAIGFDAVERTVARLRARGVTVAMIGDNPDYSLSNPALMAYRLAARRSDAGAPFFLIPKYGDDWNVKLEAIVGPDHFFDPIRALCRDGKHCLVYARSHAVMSDNGHYSVFGADRMGALLAPLFP